MYKSYDITLVFFGSPENIKKHVYSLVSPKNDKDNVELGYFLKRLEIKPEEGIKIYGGYITYTDELRFMVEINKKEDEMAALDFIHEIYKKLYKKFIELMLEINLVIGVCRGDLYYENIGE